MELDEFRAMIESDWTALFPLIQLVGEQMIAARRGSTLKSRRSGRTAPSTDIR